MEEYGSKEYYERVYELEDRGFNEGYIPIGLRPWGYGQEENEEDWEEEEYE